MEEKKVTKISLSTFFLIISILTIIIIMCYFIYRISTQNSNAQNSNVTDLQNTVSDLQSSPKNDNNLSNSSDKNQNVIITNAEAEINTKQANTLLKKYYEKALNSWFDAHANLDSSKLYSANNNFALSKNYDKIMSEVFTKTYIDNETQRGFVFRENKDVYCAYIDYPRWDVGPYYDILEEKFTDIQIENDKITCNVKTKILNKNDNPNEEITVSHKFSIKKQNNKWLVEDFSYTL